jgi:hypothetical protein
MKMKLLDKLSLYIGGMLSSDVLTNTSKDPAPIVIMQQKEVGSKLMQSLIKKEVTQEVAELRWRIYMLERSCDKINVVRDGITGELKTIRIDPEFTKPRVFEEKNKKVLVVQNTEPVQSGTDNNITDGIKLHELHKIKQVYPLKFERYNISRCEFDKSCYQVVMKQSGKKRLKFYLDFYFYHIPDPYERTKRLTTLDLQKVYENKHSINFTDDWDKVEFTTNKCWGIDNAIRYTFKNKKFVGIHKWEMFYVVQYEVEVIDKVDEYKQFYQDTIQQKYDNKEERPDRYVPHSITGDDDTDKDEHCDVCGKLMDYKKLEVADYRITQEITGTGMCKECLEKYLKKNEMI